ncbi:MAG: MBL fold metallo-hydrolase [Planctomycetota bacterium]|nr:MBL fold metallo-hydrolase [Planctomycetota bacterium]
MSEAKIEILQAGYCVHPEHVVLRTWKFSPMRFPSMFAVIEHPREGVVLFDTGYSQRFLEQTQRFPECLYRWVTPPTIDPEESALSQLSKRGIGPGDVRLVVISHFHADHVSALADFPRARYLHFPEAWESVRHRRGFGAVRKGFLPGLIPEDFERRSDPVVAERTVDLPPEMRPFPRGVDLFGDERFWAIPLPGHATGQLGLWVREGCPGRSDTDLFLVADACWSCRSFQERRRPHRITGLLFDSTREYRRIFDEIVALHERGSAVRILPSHCEESLSELIKTD